ncbi:MAG: cytochrome c3 family protein [bacterium]
MECSRIHNDRGYVSVLKRGAVGCMAVFLIILPTGRTEASVAGLCSNCHIMHAQEDGIEHPPDEYLTKEDCVGCHSSTEGSTMLSLGSGSGASRVPIVFNTIMPAEQSLAGGNFYWVTTDDTMGHNVMGISEPDSHLGDDPLDPIVPGSRFGSSRTNMKVSECLQCHESIGHTGGIPWGIERDKNYLICQDCHHAVRHHAPDPPSSDPVVEEENGWYRFLFGVNGLEDPDWEQSPSSTQHNEYQGETSSGGGSISEICAQCHMMYHALRSPGDVGTGSPWLRHPSDVPLPSGTPPTEYEAYTEYNPQVPVARPDLTGFSGPRSSVTPGEDQVMCLSCHRAHGTPYPDLLRWDYTEMVAGDDTASGGCLVCHAHKND